VRKNCALHLAASNGHEAVVRLLLKEGAEQDCRDQLGNTPVHTGQLVEDTSLW